MPPDSTGSINILFDRSQWTITNMVQLIAALIGSVVAVYSFPQLAPYIIALFGVGLVAYLLLKRWRIQRELPNEFSAKKVIREAARYYILPYCSRADPTQRDAAANPKTANPESQPKLFDEIDKFINETPDEPYLWLLGDSGTGKSSFVLNYFARNRRRRWWKRQRIFVVRLGLPEPQKYITPIRKKAKTVLFLDGFDEDTNAVQNYAARFHELMGWCREFKRMLMTCRTQFFPSDAAIPRSTNILRPAVRAAGTSPTFKFSKLYIAPFTDEQVRAYLVKRFPSKQQKKREDAFAMVKSHSTILQRPMLLAYVPDLLERGKTFQYTFQFYEEMVDAWLERDHAEDADKATLRDFSERLAIDLYTNREKRGAERVERELLIKLTQEWNNFNLNDWKLSSRSLLNRDAAGYYKFAHRSIMEYLFVKRVIDKDHRHIKISRTDQMNAFLLEMFKSKSSGLISDSTQGKNIDIANYPMKLRSQWRPSFTDDDAHKMIKEWGFFDLNKNREGKGVFHLYEHNERNGAETVTDYATGLMWQQSGSPELTNYANVHKYIRDLTNQKFAGYNDWRLPTLEEAMSLMEPEKKDSNLYIDPIFDKRQKWIYTADEESAGRAWDVGFNGGGCGRYVIVNDYYVRAVRSGQSII